MIELTGQNAESTTALSTAPIPETPNCEAPSRLATLLEARAPLEVLGLAARLRSLAAAPRGDRRPVLLVPGYLADGYSMAPLGTFLKFLGYRVLDWGLGRNRGDVEEDILRLGGQVEKISEALGSEALGSKTLVSEPLTLIGWSLGGVLCREVARLYEPRVREVITFGTPIVGGPKYTAVAQMMVRLKDIDLPILEQDILRRNRLGLRQPVASIFSKSDGVVGWRSSVDVFNSQARNIEVTGSHLGLGLNAEVWLTIADLLATDAAPPEALRRDAA
ncbi:MAG: hypothetical protein AAGE94_08625 [Acidobacteriota bacterium]